MSSNYDLTKEQIIEGLRLCKDKVNLLLNGSEKILSNGDRYISSGLYTHAVEEVGKYLLLQKELRKTPNTDGKISVDPDIFSKHPKKFKEFQNKPEIPDECKKIKLVVGGIPTSYHVWADGRLISQNTGVLPIHREEFMNFEFRKKIFYVGWENGKWIGHQDVEVNDLNKAITELRKWVRNLPNLI